MGRSVACWLGVCAALVLGWADAAAQLRVRVVDRDGLAVPEATVEAWSATGRLGTWQTDADGVAVLDRDLAAAARKLRVLRIGFRPVRILVEPSDRVLVARLEPLVIVAPECVPGEIVPEYAGPRRVRPDEPDAACPPTVIRAGHRPKESLTVGAVRS